LGSNYVISFRERDTGLFAPIRERIQAGQGRLRTGGADYLTYRLLDAVVDSYFAVVEHIEDGLEAIEDEVVTNPSPGTLHAIQHNKRNLIALRKAVWPLREVIGALERRETPLIGEGVTVFLRDVYDHTVQLIDTVETLRDVLSGILDVYLSSLSNRLNEVMKVLTIIATIFMPLAFITGMYGMNFEHFPEIRQPWGYPYLFWGLCLGTAGTMIQYFRRKRWM
jgi:magnesium transporter